MHDDWLPHGNVDDDINPYTGERVPVLDSTVWGTASASDLYKQLSVLESRFYTAQTLGKVDIQNQIRQAIAQLKSCIAEAVKRDAKRPIKKRPNTHESRPNNHSPFE